MVLATGGVAVWLGAGAGLHAQSGAAGGEWRAYAADKAGSKYSPLDRITKDNVADLRIAWRQSTIPDAVRNGNTMPAPRRSQNTPLMAGGCCTSVPDSAPSPRSTPPRARWSGTTTRRAWRAGANRAATPSAGWRTGRTEMATPLTTTRGS